MTAADTKIARAAQARRILEDTLVVEAFDAIEREAFNAWRNSEPEDSERRELVAAELRAMKRFRQKLQAVMSDGAVATFDRNMVDRKQAKG